MKIDIKSLDPNKCRRDLELNPRDESDFSENNPGFAALLEEIKLHGQLEPGRVCISPDQETNTQYLILRGANRHAVAQKLEIPFLAEIVPAPLSVEEKWQQIKGEDAGKQAYHTFLLFRSFYNVSQALGVPITDRRVLLGTPLSQHSYARLKDVPDAFKLEPLLVSYLAEFELAKDREVARLHEQGSVGTGVANRLAAEMKRKKQLPISFESAALNYRIYTVLISQYPSLVDGKTPEELQLKLARKLDRHGGVSNGAKILALISPHTEDTMDPQDLQVLKYIVQGTTELSVLANIQIPDKTNTFPEKFSKSVEKFSDEIQKFHRILPNLADTRHLLQSGAECRRLSRSLAELSDEIDRHANLVDE